jgi:DASS family divalent anion:Na+ symporter
MHLGTESHEPSTADARPAAGRLALRWLFALLPAIIILSLSPPEGITDESWRLFAVFASTVAGMISHPLPGGAMVLLGVLATAASGALPIEEALGGYADPVVWLVLAAFFMSRGMIKTGLGRRIALLFIRAIGHHSLGLGYALIATDMLLGMVIPSNGARAGGIVFPVTRSMAEAYDSRPGPTAGRLGAFLMVLVYQCDVIVCAMFLTGQASNALIAKFALQETGIEVNYGAWLVGAVVPGLTSLVVVPYLLYKAFPPEVKHTPQAAVVAREGLRAMGPMRPAEICVLVVFLVTAALWMTTKLHNIHYAVVAMGGIGVLLVAGVLQWDDLMGDRAAWDVFIWYGGLVRLAEALGETGLTRLFAEKAASYTEGWPWWGSLLLLLLVYFYSHYAFASITAHASAMFMPFLAVTIAAGAPAVVAVLAFAYLSNLNASLTHYGTTPAPIYFGAGYVTQRTWWWLGLLVSFANLLIWLVLGPAWWKLLGWW